MLTGGIALANVYEWLPSEAVKILLVLFCLSSSGLNGKNTRLQRSITASEACGPSP
jgi:hypothetical protein